MIIVFIGYRQAVKSPVYLFTELILGMIDQHRSQRIAAIGKVLLRLRGDHRAEAEESYDDLFQNV
jgi:hypothetical protein